MSQQNSASTGSPVKSWNLTRTTQFKDPGDVIISDPAVLKVRGKIIFIIVCGYL